MWVGWGSNNSNSSNSRLCSRRSVAVTGARPSRIAARVPLGRKLAAAGWVEH